MSREGIFGDRNNFLSVNVEDAPTLRGSMCTCSNILTSTSFSDSDEENALMANKFGRFLKLEKKKDRANGQGAMGFFETVEENGNEDDQHNDDDPFYQSDELNGNVNMSSTNTPLTQSSKKADSATRRMKVFYELKKIDGMTNAQRVKVGQLLIHDQANLDYFFTLDEEFKLDFLLSLLE
ncbi:hypothetical protein LWI29_036464 [Acer saccharum]|uniref:Uncharacterized protein n=1 Tax=Acer saccharum TaxID=4024 RepID=A0AA39VXH3_ACESA|nr:hypothetical protein LWI29_036464 [Acer saccharum]